MSELRREGCYVTEGSAWAGLFVLWEKKKSRWNGSVEECRILRVRKLQYIR